MSGDPAGLVVGRCEPLRLTPDGWLVPLRIPSLSEEDKAELRKALAKSPHGPIVMVPREPGPIEHLATLKAMQRHLNRLGGERAELARQVEALQRENRRLVDEAVDARRRQMLALESMAVMSESLGRADEAAVVTRESYQVALPLADWHEDIGPVLWWFFPVQEAPWCGTPGCSDWPGYHTHWTPLPGVAQPDGTAPFPTPMPARLLRKAEGQG